MRSWDVITASVLGGAHERNGLGTQDAVATLTSADDATLCIAVADGHGGERYVRSATGARFAVEAALTHLPSTRCNDLCAVAQQIVATWRAAVRADVLAHPFTDTDELEPVVAYGTTLIAVVATPTDLVVAQLGDGDVLVVRGDTVERPIADDIRLLGGATTSLCLPTAVDDFRFAHLTDIDTIDLVLIGTDGYGNSFVADEWEHQVGTELAACLRTLGPAEFARQLPEWLTESANASGDDTTVAIVHPLSTTTTTTTTSRCLPTASPCTTTPPSTKENQQ